MNDEQKIKNNDLPKPSDNTQLNNCTRCNEKPCVCNSNGGDSIKKGLNQKGIDDKNTQKKAKRPKISWI